MKELVLQEAPQKIKHIQFSVLSTQEIVALSEYESTQRDLYSISGAAGHGGLAIPGAPEPMVKMPAKGGVLDSRLGTSDKSGTCGTCNSKMADCVGHYSYIKLVLPVFHIGYFRAVIQMLQDICKTCARVLLSEEDRRLYLQRFRRPNLENLQRQHYAKQVNTACRKVLTCPYCGATNGTVKKVGALRIIHEKFRAKKKADELASFRDSFLNAIKETREIAPHLHKAQEDMNPLRVLNLFKRVTPSDCELLGLDPEVGRPEEYIWQYIHVPPVCIRPSVTQEAATNEDDVTVKLTEIIFTNTLLKTGLVKGVPTQNIMEQWEFMQLSVAMYINAELPGVPSQMAKGKTGRFRGNLSGKRVDFSGRTVIGPDPNLSITEVAVPDRVAKILTYPERVTAHNIERLKQCVRNGPDVHPGANYLVAAGLQGAPGVVAPFKRSLRFGNRNQIANTLRLGDTVERHLHDGDIVLFNRQPSLHKLSIMSHRAKIRPWRTFRFNECVCTPYNADFDGDEMNLHVPQTEEARTEATELMNIKYNLVTPRNGEPIIAATQDFITASYLLSRKDNFYDRQQFGQIIQYLSDATLYIDLPPPVIWKPVRLWTGKQVFNILMRPNKACPVKVNVEAKCATHQKASPEFLPDMSPNDGWLVIQNSEVMCGVVDKAIVGGGKKDSIFAVINRDFGPDEAVKAMNRLAKVSARWLANMGFSIGVGDVTPGERLSKQKDELVAKAYAETKELIHRSKAGKLETLPGRDLDQTLEAMISGVLSKVRDALGEICMAELTRNNAPLIMATCGSKGSKINVAQMVACVGQQIISGNRIPDGFQDRSLPHFHKKAKEPPAKGFVRNSFHSGLRATEFLFHAISGREGLVDTAVKTAETGYMQRRLMKALEDLSTRYDDSVRSSSGGIVQFTYGDDGLDPTYLEGDGTPVEFVRTWRHARATISQSEGRGLYPYEIIKLTRDSLSESRFTSACTERFRDSVLNFMIEQVAQPAARYRTSYGMYAALENEGDWDEYTDLSAGASDASKKIISNKTQVTRKQIEGFLDLCWIKYVKAKVEPGTAVGAVGAQSIGEPGTQMTLKTFHFAGVASMNITLGVPRIKEIINASKLINGPIINAPLVANNNERAARIVKARLEKTYLGDITSLIEGVYSNESLYLGIHVDMDTVRRLQLEVTLDSIKWAIISAPKLNIKEDQVQAIPRKNRIKVYVDTNLADGGKSLPFYQRLMFLRRVLPGVVIKGLPKAGRTVINKNASNEFELLVEGYGLRDVMTTNGVVGTRTMPNHIMEAQTVLGIEAARNCIIKEISYTMDSHGLKVDPRHMMLLGDIMCFKGEVLGITRFGIAKMKDSVLMLASFEKTTDHLFDAALYSKRDAIEGVSECIIMGNPANDIGTSAACLVSEVPKLPPRREVLFY
ncbi:DNA-directed RNA polymerase III subunit C1 [Phakopsora pachyrhizi]|nr:DNA-directed RNA polymerase III subunit C1 [Phakopsora pachyrhizi]